MLNHVTLLKFKRRTADTDVDHLERELDRLADSIVEIQMLEFGRNVIQTSNCYDFAVLALFANEETLGRCLQHPQHLSLMETIERLCDSIVTVDFFGSDAGSLKEKPLDNWLLGDDYSKP